MQKARRHCQKAAPTACRRRVSGSLSPFSSKCFSPFLHSTRPLSVSREYSALPDGPGGFAQDSSCPALLRMPLCRRKLRVRGYHPPRLSSRFPSLLPCNTAVLQPPACVATRRVWAPPRSLAATGGIIGLFSFPPGTKMFQFPGLALPHPAEVPVLQTGGLSHSEIRGSTVTCTYPRLVAACHVLRRLREPRHPPCALNYFLAVAACPRTWAGTAAAHTFSCSVRSRPVRNIPQGGGRFSVVNFTVLLVSICQRSARNAAVWRITDSNR